jgi:Cu-Zn family superoxide dismutase
MLIHKTVAVLTMCLLVCTVVLGIWTTVDAQHEEKKAEGAAITKAVAVLFPTKGSDVKGRVTFTEGGRTIHVHAEISGLTPGEHGFHIHEFGVWSEDGMASGPHFDPTKSPHAAPTSPKRHIGDLGNVRANASGNVNYEVDDPHLRFHGPHSIIGRGVVVHEKVDDLKTQPSGNAGGRLAVGIIGVAKP